MDAGDDIAGFLVEWVPANGFLSDATYNTVVLGRKRLEPSLLEPVQGVASEQLSVGDACWWSWWSAFCTLSEF